MRLAVVLCLCASTAWGANAALYDAIRLHQDGEFSSARDALAHLETDPHLSEDDRVTAAEYLASCLLSLKDRAGAKDTLKRTLRRHREARLDPNLFFPEVIALAEEARIELDAEQPPPSTLTQAPVAGAPAPPAAAVAAPVPEGGGRAWAKAPLIAGSALVVGAAVLETLAFVQYQDLQQSTPPSPGATPSPYQNTGRDLQLAAQVTGAVGLGALAIAGGLYVLGAPPQPVAQGVRLSVGTGHLGLSGTF